MIFSRVNAAPFSTPTSLGVYGASPPPPVTEILNYTPLRTWVNLHLHLPKDSRATVVYIVTVFSYRPRLWKVDYIAPSDCGDLHANVTLSLAPTFPHVSPAATSITGLLCLSYLIVVVVVVLFVNRKRL